MKKISSIFLILSLILIFLGYGTMRESFIITKGNKLSFDKIYTEADKLFKRAVDLYSSKTGYKNRGVNLYNGEEYDKLIESGAGEKFFRGNAYVFLGEREKDPKKIMEIYEKSLEEYRGAMKVSRDMNIKRNYEIISKRVEDMKNMEQKKQEQNMDNKNQKDQNKDKQDKRDKGQDQQPKDQQQDGSGSDQKSSDKKEASQQDQNKTDKQKKDQGKEDGKKNNNENSPGKEDNKANEQQKEQGRRAEKDTPQRREALTILERLEGSEDQAFKNNERLESIGGEDSHDTW